MGGTGQNMKARIPRRGVRLLAAAFLAAAVAASPGCFAPVDPDFDREERVWEALTLRDGAEMPVSPLGSADAVAYALRNNLDAVVAEIEASYQNESAVAARRRLLPSLTARYSADSLNHPSARWSESSRSGNQSLESSFSSEQNTRRSEIGMVWNLLDFGVGYLKSRQQQERTLHAEQQTRRIRQQIVLDVLTQYWRASAASVIAAEAAALEAELREHIDAIRDSVDMRILSAAEGARRELAAHGSLSELEQLTRLASQSKLELSRAMGCPNAVDFDFAEYPADSADDIPLPNGDPAALQAAALRLRPELFQQDAKERIALDDARMALLQMAPNANVAMSLHNDPDKFLEWSNWMSLGARVSWNLFAIPARLSERRMARLQQEMARRKGLAVASAVLAQVGIAYSDWRLTRDYSGVLFERVGARRRLVDALAAGEEDGQARPGEVLVERVRLLGDRASAMQAGADARIAAARLANAVGLDVDECGQLVWNFEDGDAGMTGGGFRTGIKTLPNITTSTETNREILPTAGAAGLRVVRAEEFLTPDEFFEQAAYAAE